MSDEIELVLKIGAFVITVLLFIKGIYEYTKAQKWKKAEFVSKEIKEFNSDFDMKRAMILLDWTANELELKVNELGAKNKLSFTDELIVSSLQTHKERDRFSEEEVVIKCVFDAFFDRLILFDHYLEAGLIQAKDIKPYLNYWIAILADPQNNRKSKEVRTQIWEYMDEYGYGRLRLFCAKFGYHQH